MTDLSRSRRDFIKRVAAGTAGFALSMPAASYARVSGANQRIALGFIGMGQMARGHLRSFMNEPDVDVLALCDVYQPNLDYAAAMAPNADTYADFRRIIERADIDAVVVATPDHWHAIPTIMACEAGKDVYVEKPASHTIEEGRKMVEAARQNDRIVQVGTQQRSDEHFQRAVEIVHSGQLGPITFVRTWNYSNDYPDGWGQPPDTEPPAGLDWDMWLGPAPEVPFNINRFGVVQDDDGDYTRWASWRHFWDYGGGLMTDWGVHLLDIVQWAIDADYPRSIATMGGTFCLQDNRDTPDTLQVTYQYDDCVCVYENRVCNDHPIEGEGYGIMFHGTEGTMYLNRAGFEITPQQDSILLPKKMEENDRAKSHRRDFLDSIESRERTISDIEIGHRSTSAAILGNVALLTGQRIEWDGEREEVKGDGVESSFLSKEYREPWSL